MKASNSNDGTNDFSSTTSEGATAPAPFPDRVPGVPTAASLSTTTPSPAIVQPAPPGELGKVVEVKTPLPPGYLRKPPPGWQPGQLGKKPPVSAGKHQKPQKGARTRTYTKDRRLEGVIFRELPRVPPLSVEIPYITKKLEFVPFFFRDPPGDLDWGDSNAVRTKYPPLKGYGRLRPPYCLMLDAATDQDKLVIINWWRLKKHEHQKQELEDLRAVYATPHASNRPVPDDYWDRMKKSDERRLGLPPKLEPKIVKSTPKVDTPLVPRVFLCRGWKAEKYNPLFRPCLMAEVAKTRSTMKGSAAAMPDRIPIPESISKSKYAVDVHFMREGDDYVLRSRECKKVASPPRKSKDGNGRDGIVRFLCDSCSKSCSLVADLRVKPIKNPHVNDLNIVIDKQKAEIRQLKLQIKNALRREERRKQRSERDAEFSARVELDKRQNAAQSLTVLYKRKGALDEDSDDCNDEVDHYNTYAHSRNSYY